VEDNSSNGSTRLCGWLDPPLSALGHKQAEDLAGNVASCFPLDSLYASSLQRSRETAGYLAAAARLRPRLLRSLREINCGRLEGWRLTDIRRDFPELWQRNLSQQDDEFRWPGGESYLAFRRRVLRTLAGIVERHRGGTILLVTHAGVINQIFGSIHGLRPARWEPYRPSNASVSELAMIDGGEGRIVRFDQKACSMEATTRRE
jgi:broad specificity phosphatase PhoE